MISTQFLQNCQAGDEDAIQALVRTHQRGVFQLALSILDDAALTAHSTQGGAADAAAAAAVAEAETATRETFLRAIDRLGSYREDTPFTTWLYGVTIQVSRRRARRWRIRRAWDRIAGRALARAWRKITNSSADAFASAPVQGQQHLLPADQEMWAAVRGLHENLRLPVVLRYYHEFSVDEIGRLMHMSEGSVHARLDAAREKIARNLEK